MINEQQLIEKLRSIERLHAGATTPGERDAAANALDRIRRRLADIKGVSIRHYAIIYNLVDDISKALKGILEPSYIEIIDGRAEIRDVFPAGKNAKAAGIYITEGKAVRGAATRIKHGDEVVAESTISSLKRFKDNVREVSSGYECGAVIDGYNEFQVGDTLEFFHKEKSN